MHSKATGFTLIELLVVIAIVLFVGSLMFKHEPWLSKDTTSLADVGVVDCDASNYEKEVLQATMPVYVLFCHKDQRRGKVQSSILREVAGSAEYAGKVKFVRVDLSQCPPIAKELCERYSDIDLNQPVHMCLKRGVILQVSNVSYSALILSLFLDKGIGLEPGPCD